MAFNLRSSKFRHVYGVPAKKNQCYECINITKNAHDSNFCTVNPKFVAVVTECAGGGSFLVLPIEKTGRQEINVPKVTGHKGVVLDVKWNPFNDNIIASCSEDCTVKLWFIPDGGLRSNLNDWIMDLHGHERRVASLEWHPTAENILLSAGFDYKIIVWNVGKGEVVNEIECHTDTIYSMSFNRTGSLLATTCKDKKIRIIEPRTGEVCKEGLGHQGSKSTKVVFMGDHGKLLTTGFSRMSERQLAIWDQNDLSKPLKLDIIDSSSGILIPHYDYDTNIVYIAGKGDGNIRYYELVNSAPYIHYLSEYKSSAPQRGLGTMPKRGLDVMRCEVTRFYKLHIVKGIVEPIAMVVPRKSEQFQSDIFPDTAGTLPAISADEWAQGIDKAPNLMSLKVGGQKKTHKPQVYRPGENPLDSRNLSNMKFKFVQEETKGADYRQVQHKSEKSSASSTNVVRKNLENRKRMEESRGGETEDISDGRLPKRKTVDMDNIADIPESELRKAYFEQLEEIRFLMDQVSLKDRRIQQLEDELKTR
ncbi:PREDICTED: coronin-2B-like isoform X3 [Priapulus caudatus]|nr:PREDICTED: coronin-2B-like isoform X3 [Priapulus caudatus]